jgi:2-iminobutanoate/2-iminopropanoate deaminase
MRHYDGFNEARSAFYATLPVPPASSTIGGAQFTSTDVCIEIEATAVVPGQS